MKTKLICIVASLVPVLAYADESAGDAYTRGQSALKAGRVHEACQAFEASEKAEAKVDTETALAGCYEQDGKPIAAARLYDRLATQDPNQVRRSTWAAKAKKLQANAPKLHLSVSPQVAGTTVTIDGMDAGTSSGDVLVDLGPHDIVAKAPGYEGHASAAVEKDRQVVEVAITMDKKVEATPPTTGTMTPPPDTGTTPPATGTTPPATGTTPPASEMTPPPPPESTGHAKRNGAILGGVGVAAIIGSVVLFAESSSKFDDEHNLCPNHTCGSAGDASTANDDRSTARDLRGAGYLTGVVGLALVGVGGYLFFTAKDESATHVSVQVDHSTAGLVFSGHF
nr:PEGA domain-containing protein [Kofleriaceae bacterium]